MTPEERKKRLQGMEAQRNDHDALLSKHAKRKGLCFCNKCKSSREWTEFWFGGGSLRGITK